MIQVFDCRGLEGTLKRTHCILFFTGDGDVATASWHLVDIVAMVGHCHILGQRRISKDGVVGKANVGDVKVDELSAVVFALSKGVREADLPYRDGGTVSDS